MMFCNKDTVYSVRLLTSSQNPQDVGNCFILINVQKSAPLILISYLINLNLFLFPSVLIGTIVGYNQT